MKLKKKLDRVNQKNTTLTHIIKKQGQRKNFESGRRKMICPSIEIPIRQLANFLAENLQDRGVWDDIFQGQKEKYLQPRVLYVTKTISNKKRHKVFPGK